MNKTPVKKRMTSTFITNLSKRPLVLRIYPDPVLRCTSDPVCTFNEVLRIFIGDTIALMRDNKGIGLAAPQVGVLRRIIIADIGHGPVCLVNPEICLISGTENMIEGCLSLPEQHFQLSRSKEIDIWGKTPAGNNIHFKADGLLARTLQHEVDHLDGHLICDKGIPVPKEKTEAELKGA